MATNLSIDPGLLARGAGAQRREDQEGGGQHGAARIHRAPGTEEGSGSCSDVSSGAPTSTTSTNGTGREAPDVKLFVDTSVWSLALRHAAPPEHPEVARLGDALTRGERVHDRAGPPGTAAGVSRTANGGEHHRALHRPALRHPDARRPHLSGKPAQRLPPPRGSGRNHRRPARIAVHRSRSRHALDRPGLRPHRGIDIAGPVGPTAANETLTA